MPQNKFELCPAYSVTVITVLQGRVAQTPQLLARAGSSRTATWDYWPWKVSYFNSFWSPRCVGNITGHDYRPIFTSGTEWDLQGLPLWDLQGRKIN